MTKNWANNYAVVEETNYEIYFSDLYVLRVLVRLYKQKKNNNPLQFLRSILQNCRENNNWGRSLFFFCFLVTSLVLKTKNEKEKKVEKLKDKRLKFTCFKISRFSSYSTVLFSIGFYVPIPKCISFSTSSSFSFFFFSLS